MTAPQPSGTPGASTDAGTGGQAPTGTQQPQQPAPQPPATTPPGSGTQQPATGQQGTSKTDLSTLPADVQKLITDLRAENATHRTGKTEAAQQAQAAQAQRDQILKALGLKPDGSDADPDPTALAAQVEQAQNLAWTNAVELGVVRTAATAGADPEKLLDSRAFIDSLDGFVDEDPNTPEFRTKLAAHVKDYVEKHPQFKAATTVSPARSGGQHTGGPGGGGGQRPTSLMDAVRKSFGGS